MGIVCELGDVHLVRMFLGSYLLYFHFDTSVISTFIIISIIIINVIDIIKTTISINTIFVI